MSIVFPLIVALLFMTLAVFLYAVIRAPEGGEGSEGFVFDSPPAEQRVSEAHSSYKRGQAGLGEISVSTSGGSYFIRTR